MLVPEFQFQPGQWVKILVNGKVGIVDGLYVHHGYRIRYWVDYPGKDGQIVGRYFDDSALESADKPSG